MTPFIFATLILVTALLMAIVLFRSKRMSGNATALVVAFLALVGVPAVALNDAGDHVYASVAVDDGTGVVTTVTAAGTYVTVGTAAPLVAGETDGSGCITYTLASNKFTIAARCGIGELRLRACINNAIGANSAVVLGAWHRIRSGTTTLMGPKLKSTQLSTAAQNPLGCIETIVDATVVGETYDFRFDSDTNSDTVTTRAAFFVVEKVLNK